MKNQLYILSIVFGLFAFTACEEIGPAINFETETVTPPDTTTDNKVQRTVLLEEFTGVRCANCPAGAEFAQQLADASGDRVIIISIHSSGAFALPYSGQMDFRTPQGDKIENMLGKASGYPSASINRKLFDDELTPIVTSTSWSNYIDRELAKEPVVEIELNSTLNEQQIEVTADLNFLLDVPTDIKLSVAILEDGIVGPQNVNSVKVDDYVHQHVFRTMLTAFDGELIATAASTGDTFTKKYQLAEISDEWNDQKLIVVAFVHDSGTEGVYQVAKAKL